MPSPSILNLEELLAPISGDDPAGGSVPFATRERLEEARKEVDPNQWAPNDPTRPSEFKKADWPGIIRLAQETLKQASKDLLVAARLTEALTKAHGFAGLRDGLQLLRSLVEQCWDRLNPLIETEDDLEVRAAPMFWLDEKDRGARFPSTIRAVPIARSENGPLGWQQWKDAQSAQTKITTADFEKAVAAISKEQLKTTAEDLAASLQELDALARLFREKLAQSAPDFTSMREAVTDCQLLVERIGQKKTGPAEAVTTTIVASEAVPTEPVIAVVAKPAVTREEIFERLAELADQIKKMEPHSPVPYMVYRAIDFGSMQFPELMKSLILNGDVLKVMNRELGIKDAPEKK